MSYSIFYRAMFVKMNDGSYIPMIESGDNNTWEADNRRRSRSWSSCRWLYESERQKRRYSLSEKEILSLAQQQVDDKLKNYVDKEPLYTRKYILGNFGFFSAIRVSGYPVTSASRFLGVFRAGLRNAVTMEDLRAQGCSVYLSWWEGHAYMREDARSEQELSEKWQALLDKGIFPYVNLGFNSERVWEMMKERTSKPRGGTAGDRYIVAFTYNGGERYLVKLNSRNIKFNPYPYNAFRYSSRKLAENAAERISRRFYQFHDIHVERVSA